MLRDYKLVQNQHKQLAGNSYIDDDLIFDHEDGTHISSQYADDMFRSLYEPLGLPKVDLYSLMSRGAQNVTELRAKRN